jgi:hypothetical protein
MAARFKRRILALGSRRKMGEATAPLPGHHGDALLQPQFGVLGTLALGDVARQEDGAGGGAARVAERCALQAHPAHLAALVPQQRLVLRLDERAAREGAVQQLGDRQGEQLVVGVAGQLAAAGVGGADPALDVDQQQACGEARDRQRVGGSEVGPVRALGGELWSEFGSGRHL